MLCSSGLCQHSVGCYWASYYHCPTALLLPDAHAAGIVEAGLQHLLCRVSVYTAFVLQTAMTAAVLTSTLSQTVSIQSTLMPQPASENMTWKHHGQIMQAASQAAHQDQNHLVKDAAQVQARAAPILQGGRKAAKQGPAAGHCRHCCPGGTGAVTPACMSPSLWLLRNPPQIPGMGRWDLMVPA